MAKNSTPKKKRRSSAESADTARARIASSSIRSERPPPAYRTLHPELSGLTPEELRVAAERRWAEFLYRLEGVPADELQAVVDVEVAHTAADRLRALQEYAGIAKPGRSPMPSGDYQRAIAAYLDVLARPDAKKVAEFEAGKACGRGPERIRQLAAANHWDDLLPLWKAWKAGPPRR